MKIAQLFGKGKTVFSCEVFPPKKTSPVDSIYKTLDGLKDIHPDFISVTFGAGGSSNVNQSTAEIASIIQNQYHITAMAHLTCVGCTKGEATEILAQLKNSGVENVLALRGDRNPDFRPRRISFTPMNWSPSSTAGGTSACPPPATPRGTRRAPTSLPTCAI